MTRALGACLAMLIALPGSATLAEAACTLSATSVAFGSYDVFATTPRDSTGTVTYRCGPSYHHITVTISRGSSTTFTPRTLVNGTGRLQYNLFRDAALATVWGDGTGGTDTYFIVNPPNAQDVVLTVYARVPAEQDVPAGAYADAVVVTLEY
jgi:spore coat protein U-like protein